MLAFAHKKVASRAAFLLRTNYVYLPKDRYASATKPDYLIVKPINP